MNKTAARAAFVLALVAFFVFAPAAVLNVSGMDHTRAATSDAPTLAVVGALLLLLAAAYVNYARKVLR